jgi:signal transduction histidine kinase
MLGVEQEKLIHRPLSDFVDSASWDLYYLHCQRTLTDRRRTESEIWLVKQTRERIIVRIESVIDRGDPTQLMVMLADITNQRQLERQQQENATQMVLQRRLIEHSEMERVELARNLHEGPIQGLASMGFSIQIIKEILKEYGVDGDANLEQLGDDVKNLISELRGICNDLRPPLLSKLGLRRAIAENVEELQAKYPRTKINLELSDDPISLPDPIAIAIYRIYQQAMNNIYRHANASEVWVRLKIDPRQILFEIQDNGQGISGKVDWDKYARQGHLGLVGMKERAEAIGGTLDIISTPEKGTTIRVIVHLV